MELKYLELGLRVRGGGGEGEVLKEVDGGVWEIEEDVLVVEFWSEVSESEGLLDSECKRGLVGLEGGLEWAEFGFDI